MYLPRFWRSEGYLRQVSKAATEGMDFLELSACLKLNIAVLLCIFLMHCEVSRSQFWTFCFPATRVGEVQ